MENVLETLVIGLGNIGMLYDYDLDENKYIFSHVQAITKVKELNLVGAIEPNFEYQKKFVSKYKKPVFSNLKDLPTGMGVDFLVIATPTSTHHKLFFEACNKLQPKVILMEKPLSNSLEEAYEMVNYAKNNGIHFYVNYFRSFNPINLKIQQLISDCEEIRGTVYYTKGLQHNGSHFFNLLEMIFGNPIKVGPSRIYRTLENGDKEVMVFVEFDKVKIVFIPLEERNYSFYWLNLHSSKGKLTFKNGGKEMTWEYITEHKILKDYKKLGKEQFIYTNHNKYQKTVYDEIIKHLNKNKQAWVCTGNKAFNTLKHINNIIKNGN